ncbi:MAG: sugar-binding protein [Granulosicoccus sp.]
MISDSGDTTNLTLYVPSLLAQTRAISIDQLVLETVVNGSPVEMQRQDGEWTGVVYLPVGEIAQIKLTWSLNLADGSQPIRLAAYEDEIGPITSSIDLLVTNEDYKSEIFDDDEDLVSNLDELRQGSNPRDPSEPVPDSGVPPTTTSIVSIPRIDARDAPVIDGNNDAVWAQGEALPIDQLILGHRVGTGMQETNFHWTALHDGTYLYVLVKGKYAEGSVSIPDSSQQWLDNGMEIYIDSDNSKLNNYDGINDYSIVIPHLKGQLNPLEANNSVDNNGRFFEGAPSAEWPTGGFNFANCLCIGDEEKVWELRINLALFGIGQEIGFEVHLNHDLNGGGRDTKWGWFSARDSAANRPSAFGTAKLQQ